MIEIGCLIVVGVVTWMVASEGIYGAAQVFLSTLLAALVAMNFFEALAPKLRSFLPNPYCDFVALVGLFIALVFAFRMGSEQISPSYIQIIPTIDSIGRWVMGAATGYLTMAFLLTSLHTAPLPREFMGFKPERNNFFGAAPDRQWLGFVQYVSEKPLIRLTSQKIGAKTVYVPHAFDGRYEKVGDPDRPYSVRDSSGRDIPQVIWPSFPIRYAMRRDRLALNQSSAAPAPLPVMIPQAAPAPTKGGAPVENNPGF
jgi:hypothetical protein